MKRLLPLALAASLLLSAGPALGQAGTIMLYGDPTYTSCNLVDVAPGNVFIYVVHNYASAKSSQWKLENCCHTMVWITDIINPPNLKFGLDSQRGMAVGYGGCQASPWLIAQVFYSALGNSPTCSWIWVVADPSDATGQITGSSCTDQLTFPADSKIIINGDGTCPCGPLAGSGHVSSGPRPWPCPCPPTPVEATTWGQVKALYE